MRHPVNKVFITQEWGVNPDVYARFGLKGHNGTDYRLFDKAGNRSDTAEIFAPHEGVVIETGWDANGYGNYIKIENSKEGSILAHLREFKVKVGDNVKEGQLVAVGNNTGFSTGAHLHWGYYPIPRHRDNGYSGTINQIPLLESTTQPTSAIYSATVKQLVTDNLLALKGNTSDDEINAWVVKFENPYAMVNDVLRNDNSSKTRWLEIWGVPETVEVIKEVPVETIVEKTIEVEVPPSSIKGSIARMFYSLAISFSKDND